MAIPSTGAVSFSDIQTEFGGSNPISLSEYYAGGGLVPAGTTGTQGAVPSSGAINVNVFHGTSNITPAGQVEYTRTRAAGAANFSWTCPQGVTSVSVIVVAWGGNGGSSAFNGMNYDGGQGGPGGGLVYTNSISVTPGSSYTVAFSDPANSNRFYFGSTANGYANAASNGSRGGTGAGGAAGSGGTGRGQGGYGRQGSVNNSQAYYAVGGGGGGGPGYQPLNNTDDGKGGTVRQGGYSGGISSAQGGGGGGSGGDDSYYVANGGGGAAGGGGTGVLGKGSNGTGGAFSSPTANGGGAGSTGGTNGSSVNTNTTPAGAAGGNYGAGGGGAGGGAGAQGGAGGAAIIRIIWAGQTGITRAYPSTNTGNL